MGRLCKCFDPCFLDEKWIELEVHAGNQDQGSEAWLALLEITDHAAKDKRGKFVPRHELGAELWDQIKTLPKEISTISHIPGMNHTNGEILFRCFGYKSMPCRLTMR